MGIHSWYDKQYGTITYSMYGSRNGADGTADCSGSISQALKDAGYQISGLPSTVNLGNILAGLGWKRIHVWNGGNDSGWNAVTEDIILMSWSSLGMSASGGAGGHVGIIHDGNETFESTDYWTGGQANTAISRHNMSAYLMTQMSNGLKYYEVWRKPGSNPAPAPVQKASNKPKTAIDQFKAANNEYTATKLFKVDAIKKVNGIWQIVNYALAGGKNFNWTDNGIPVAVVDNVTRGNSAPTKVGDSVKFAKGYDDGTIDEYDLPTNGVGIILGQFGITWFDANAFIKL